MSIHLQWKKLNQGFLTVRLWPQFGSFEVSRDKERCFLSSKWQTLSIRNSKYHVSSKQHVSSSINKLKNKTNFPPHRAHGRYISRTICRSPPPLRVYVSSLLKPALLHLYSIVLQGWYLQRDLWAPAPIKTSWETSRRWCGIVCLWFLVYLIEALNSLKILDFL